MEVCASGLLSSPGRRAPGFQGPRMAFAPAPFSSPRRLPFCSCGSSVPNLGSTLLPAPGAPGGQAPAPAVLVGSCCQVAHPLGLFWGGKLSLPNLGMAQGDLIHLKWQEGPALHWLWPSLNTPVGPGQGPGAPLAVRSCTKADTLFALLCPRTSTRVPQPSPSPRCSRLSTGPPGPACEGLQRGPRWPCQGWTIEGPAVAEKP